MKSRPEQTGVQYAVAITEAVWQSAVRPALVRAAPTFALLFFVCAGLLRQTPLFVAVGDPALLVAAAALWLATTAYPKAAVLGAPTTQYLRSLPMSRAAQTLAALGALLVVDAPWLAMCLWTGDPFIIAVGPALALGGQVTLSARRPVAWACILLAATAAAAADRLGTSALAAGVAATLSLTVAAAFAPAAWHATRSLGPRFRIVPAQWVLPRSLELVRAYLGALPTRDPWFVLRSAVVATLATALGALVLRNNDFFDVSRALPPALVVLAMAAAVALPRPADHVIELQKAVGWVLATTGTGVALPVVAGAATVALIGGVFGASVGLGIAGLRSLDGTLLVVGHAAVAGGCLALAFLGLASWARADGEVDSGRLGISLLALTVVNCFVLAANPTSGLGVAAGQGLVGALVFARLAHRESRLDARTQ